MSARIGRRATLAGLAITAASPGWSAAFAAPVTDKRLVVIILRGALDGLSAVPAYGDPRLAELRGPLVPPPPGAPGGMFDLGGYFGLHPALPGLASLYRSGELLIVHAVASATRSRSHFEAQDALECGAPQRMASGWLNRVVAALPAAATPAAQAFSVGVGLPLLLRGQAPAESWLPDIAGAPSADLLARIAALNADDPALGRAVSDGLAARGFDSGVLHEAAPKAGATPSSGIAALAAQAGRLLASQDGPRIAALELGGWDTHAAQAARVTGPLRQLDQTVMALRGGLGEAWGKSVVFVMTEFGRTVRVNGTLGTDHGTASVAFVAGGAVAGGRVAGTWPGLKQGALFEDRDLAPTTDLRAVACGILEAQYGFGGKLMGQIFPAWRGVLPGVLRA
jgi:uncharacterized protein (DUF1501 family)